MHPDGSISSPTIGHIEDVGGACGAAGAIVWQGRKRRCCVTRSRCRNTRRILDDIFRVEAMGKKIQPTASQSGKRRLIEVYGSPGGSQGSWQNADGSWVED